MCDDQKYTVDIFEGILNEDAPPTPEGAPEYICGSHWVWRRDPATKKLIKYPVLCNKPRICKVCHDRRKKRFQARVYQAQDDGLVAVVPLSSESGRQLKAELSKDDYFALPADDDEKSALFVMAGVAQKHGVDFKVVFDFDLPEWTDWDALTDTPEGKRPSGNLGKRKEEEEEGDEHEEPVVVQVMEYKLLASDDYAASQAFAEADEATSHLDPHTLDELLDSIALCQIATDKALKEHGVIVVSSRLVDVKTKISCLSWQDSNKQLNSASSPTTQPQTAVPPEFSTD